MTRRPNWEMTTLAVALLLTAAATGFARGDPKGPNIPGAITDIFDGDHPQVNATYGDDPKIWPTFPYNKKWTIRLDDQDVSLSDLNASKNNIKRVTFNVVNTMGGKSYVSLIEAFTK